MDNFCIVFFRLSYNVLKHYVSWGKLCILFRLIANPKDTKQTLNIAQKSQLSETTLMDYRF
ncbi:MAG TPA: hypothetical protein DER05_06180 [Lutibacter sp.]|nr:hypothetical protein [Lutibacter sp.]